MKLTVAKKLYAGFGMVLMLAAVIAALGYTRVQQGARSAEDAYQQGALGIKHALETNVWMIARAREEKRAFLTPPGEARTKLIAEAREGMAKATRATKDYEQTYASDEDRRQWEAVVAQVKPVQAQRGSVLDFLAAGKDDEAKAQAAKMSDAIAAMNKGLLDAANLSDEVASTLNRDLASAATTAQRLMIGISIFAIATGAGIAFWLSRGISGGVNKMKAAAQGIAQGDIQQDVDIRSSDEIGEMAVAFKEMIAYLADTAGIAEQIAAGNLTVRVQPKSERDALGNAFAEMVRTLHGAMSETAPPPTPLPSPRISSRRSPRRPRAPRRRSPAHPARSPRAPRSRPRACRRSTAAWRALPVRWKRSPTAPPSRPPPSRRPAP